MDNPIQKKYMHQAIAQARKAWALDEVPIGCVIVYDGKEPAGNANKENAAEREKTPTGKDYPAPGTVIARGYNRRITDRSTLAHAEITAIKKACKVLGDWRLEDCTMYVTLEPCPMCAGAIVQARIPRVVMGSMNPKAGCAGSVLDLFHQDGLNHRVDVAVGVCGEECSEMLKSFFKRLRKK